MDEYNRKSYKMYYIVCAVIVVVLAIYFLFTNIKFEDRLTEQRCKDILSGYDPAIGSAKLNYVGGVATYSTAVSNATFVFSGTEECMMLLSPQKIIKGTLHECSSGEDIYYYVKEHEQYYELEATTNGITLVDLVSKTPEVEQKFTGIIANGLCGAGQ